MSETALRVQVPAQMMEQMIARARDREEEPDRPAPWPWQDGLSVMPERPVAYGNQELHGVIATDGESDGERQVVVVLFNRGGQAAHRAFHYRAETATAHGSGGADGPVSEAQMDTDGRLVGEILSLLAHGDGELIKQEHTTETDLLYNGESPPMLWREGT